MISTIADWRRNAAGWCSSVRSGERQKVTRSEHTLAEADRCLAAAGRSTRQGLAASTNGRTRRRVSCRRWAGGPPAHIDGGGRRCCDSDFSLGRFQNEEIS